MNYSLPIFFSTALFLSGCGGGGDQNPALDGGYLNLNGTYLCKARSPYDKDYTDRTINFTATDTIAKITGGTDKTLNRWKNDINNLPSYTDAKEIPITTSISFEPNNRLKLIEGILTNPSNSSTIISYLGVCVKEGGLLDEGYLALNGTYRCQASPPCDATYLPYSYQYFCQATPPYDATYPERTIQLEVTDTTATLTGEETKSLNYSAINIDGLPIYTDAKEIVVTTSVSFDANRAMLLVEGTLTDVSNLRIVASYVGDCKKQ